MGNRVGVSSLLSDPYRIYLNTCFNAHLYLFYSLPILVIFIRMVIYALYNFHFSIGELFPNIIFSSWYN